MLSKTEMFIGILIGVILAGILAYIFWNEKNKAKKAMLANKPADGATPPTLQLQLHAYERLILLSERIALPELISRLNQPGLSAREMQFVLTNNIRQEFEHNVTQQLYVSAESWDAVRNLKDQNIHIINQVASYLPAEASGTDLNKHLLEMLVQNPKASLHTVVAEVLSYEAKKLM